MATTPTFGQTGQSVKDYQTSLNNQFSGQAGYVPLKVDGIFGAKTQAAANFKPTVAPTDPTASANVIKTSDLAPTTTIQLPSNQKTASVVSYRDNPDGTTTNYLSDGSQSIVRYTKNADGSLTPYETSGGVQNFADQYLQQIQSQDTPAQNASTELSKSILSLLPGLEGQSQALTEAQNQAGLPTLKADLQSINAQILKKQAEINQDDVKLVASMRAEETRDTLLPFAQNAQAKLAGDAAIIRGLKNAEIGVLNAQALAKQGEIQLAQETAKEAVDARFAPYKERIATYQAQLEALQPILTRDEKKQATEQQFKSQIALKKISDLMDFQKESLSAAILNGAPQSVLNKITSSQSIEDITKIGGNYIVSPEKKLDLAIKRATLSEKYADIAKKMGSGGTTTLDATEYGKFTSTPSYKAVNDGGAYKRALEAYKATVQKYGSGEILNAKAKGELNSAYATLVGTIKDYYTLGTLDAGVEKLVSLGINKPNVLKRDKKVIAGIDTQIKQADSSIKSGAEQLLNSPYKNSIELQTLLTQNLSAGTPSNVTDFNNAVLQGLNTSNEYSYYGQ